MPFMNVYGNGGILTTVGDWIKWNAMLDSRSLGTALVDAMETQGVLNDGRKIVYALGLEVGTYKGVKMVSHGGATAGYQTYLARYPEKKVSVAVMCNGPSPSATAITTAIADQIFGLPPYPPIPSAKVSDDELKRFVGLWRNEKTHFPGRFVIETGVTRWNGGRLWPQSGGHFIGGNEVLKFAFDKAGKPTSVESIGDDGFVTRFSAEPEWAPGPSDLAAFTGDWSSDEAGATFTLAVDGGRALLRQRPATRLVMQPLYSDHFAVPGWVVWFTRDKSGTIDRMHIGASRMRDMPFVRVK
jgi:hypothetical protein